MGILGITWNWAPGETLTEARLDIIKAEIEAVVNGNIDLGTNLNPNIRTLFPIRLIGQAPSWNAAFSYPIGSIDAYAMDLDSVRAPQDFTIVEVTARRISVLPVGVGLSARLYIDGVAQAVTTITPVPAMNAAAAVVPALGVNVLAGQTLGLRVSVIAPGVIDSLLLPVEYTVWCKTALRL